jgi:hypothetical protein
VFDWLESFWRVLTNQGWRHCPFKRRRVYRVKKDFESLRDRFAKGELLRYRGEGHSIYDRMTGYFFVSAANDERQERPIRVWDIADDEDISVWSDLFELVDRIK